jgi:hypothetical protein
MLWFSSAAAASLDTMVAFSWDHHKCNCASVGAGHLSKAYAAGCSDHSAQLSWTPTLSFQFAPFRNTDKSAAEGPMQVRHYSRCTLGLHYSLSLHTVPRHAKLGAIATGLEYCACHAKSSTTLGYEPFQTILIHIWSLLSPHWLSYSHLITQSRRLNMWQNFGDIFFRSTGQEVEFILLYLHRNQPIR